MWGIFPLKTEISWEGHLFGALAGVLVAFNYRKEGPQRRVYHWDDEDDEEEPVFPEELLETDENNEIRTPLPTNEIKINFIYKEKNKDEN